LFIAVTPGYFKALQTPVLQGRPLEHQDAAGRIPVALINQTLANQLFPAGDAVGRRLRIVNPEQSSDWRTIVGVVGDVNYDGLNDPIRPVLYTPFAQTPFFWLYVMVRTPGGVDSMTQVLRTAVRDVSPALTAANIQPMTALLAGSVAEPRFHMLLVSAFAAVALLLSALGIYGVIAYSVAQRTHEIGVRMALGAERNDVLRLVVAEGLAVGGAGVILGLAAAAVLTRVMAGLLFGVAPRDPLTFFAGGSLLLVVAVAASYIPARRATRVEPVAALRME